MIVTHSHIQVLIGQQAYLTCQTVLFDTLFFTKNTNGKREDDKPHLHCYIILVH
jgi:hypothetical protein